MSLVVSLFLKPCSCCCWLLCFFPCHFPTASVCSSDFPSTVTDADCVVSTLHMYMYIHAGYRRSPPIGIPGRSSSSPAWRSVGVDEVDGGGKKFSNGIAVGGDFDHIPELDELQQTPEFNSLSLTDQAPRVRQLLSDSQSAVLTVTELEVVIQTQEEGGKEAQEIIRTRLQLIFSCSQVRHEVSLMYSYCTLCTVPS